MNNFAIAVAIVGLLLIVGLFAACCALVFLDQEVLWQRGAQPKPRGLKTPPR